eukprot:ANDGO_02321.mRNA.1 hypothetical protein
MNDELMQADSASLETEMQFPSFVKLQDLACKVLDRFQKAQKTNSEMKRQLKDHLDLLHRYNALRDTASMLAGRVAEMKQSTVSRVHEEYGIAMDD